jgi:SnoaL-like domain
MKSAMTKRIPIVLTISLILAAASSPAQPRKARTSAAELDRVLADYTKLYNAKDLAEWRKLFHPELQVASPDADGAILIRNLRQFYNAQKKAFDAGTKMSEELLDVAVDRGNRIARVAADFVLTSDGKKSRGQIGLQLVEGKEGWKITSIVYSYDRGQEPR